MTNNNSVPTTLQFPSSDNGDVNVAYSSNACWSTPTLAPGASCTWAVTYTPRVLGEDDGSITLIERATGNPTLHVTGSGVALGKPVVTAISPETGRPAGHGTVDIRVTNGAGTSATGTADRFAYIG